MRLVLEAPPIAIPRNCGTSARNGSLESLQLKLKTGSGRVSTASPPVTTLATRPAPALQWLTVHLLHRPSGHISAVARDNEYAHPFPNAISDMQEVCRLYLAVDVVIFINS